MSEDVTEESSGSGEKISDEVFDRARYEYETGQKGLVELAAEIGVTRQGLSKRFKKVGAQKGSRAHELNGKSGQKSPAEGYSANRSNWIEETRVNGFQALKQAQLVARKTLADAVKNSRPLESIDADLKAIQRYNKTLVDNIAATLNLLDADQHIDEDDLPTLTLEDLTDSEILEHHKATGALPEDATLDDLNSEDITDEDVNLEGI